MPPMMKDSSDGPGASEKGFGGDDIDGGGIEFCSWRVDGALVKGQTEGSAASLPEKSVCKDCLD